MRKNLGRIVGFSAYEVAVQNGFEGTEAEWLEALKCKMVSLTPVEASGNDVRYMMTFNDGSEYPINLKNGKEVESVVKLGSTELTSTLLFNFNDGTSATVEVPNGTGIVSIELESSSENGLTDTYKITYTDKEPSFFTVKNGVSIVSVEKTDTDGIVDTYTIRYSDGNETTYELVNGIDTVPIDYTDRFYEGRYYVAQESNIGRLLPYTPSESEPPTDTAATTKCLAVKVRAGQMFKINVTVSWQAALAYAEGYDAPVLKEVITGNLADYYYLAKHDGWIMVNCLKTDTNCYVKKVTIFDEVEENQKLLKQAVDSIPTIEEVTTAVLAALPAAEGGAF